jgi:fibronectin-binding autotransporter adhesin
MSIPKVRIHSDRASYRARHGLAIGAALAAALALTPGARALTIDWSGAGDSTWSNNGNWVGGTAPANDLLTDIARLNLASYTNQPNVTAPTSVNGIVVDSASGALTINGVGPLSVGSGGITVNAGAGAVTISVPVMADYLPTSAGSAGQNTETWTNNSSNTLLISGTISHQQGTILNFGGAGAIATNNLNTNGILGTWTTTGTGTATQFATNTTNALGGTIGGLTGTVVTDVNSMISNTDNYELTNTGGNALTNSNLTTNGTSNTIRYSGSAQTIQIGGTATAVTLTTSAILNAGTGKLTIANGASNVGGLVLGGAENVFNAASGDIELGVPVVSTSATDAQVTVTGPNRVGFNTVSTQGGGQLIFNGYGDNSNLSPGSKIMVGDSHTLTFDATSGDIRVYSPIVDNQDATPSAVVIQTTGSNRVRFSFPTALNGGAPEATYSGGLTVKAGSNFQISTFSVGSNSSLGTGTFTIEQGATIYNQTDFTPTANNASVWKGDFTVNNVSGFFTMGTGAVTLAPSNPAATAVAITNNGTPDPFNTNGMYFANIGDDGHDIGLTLNSGAMKLTGGNTFTGDLSILGGKVFLTQDNSVNRNNVIVMNAGAILDLGSALNRFAGLQDGPNIVGTPAQITTLSSGHLVNFTGTGNYTFSGNFSGGNNPQLPQPLFGGTGTQTFAGANTFFRLPAAIYQGVMFDSGTVKLDFNAATAPSTNIFFNNVTASNANFAGGSLAINGSSSHASSQTFGLLTTGQVGPGVAAGSSRITLVNNGQDVALSTGTISVGTGGGLEFVLPSGPQTATNGVLTTAPNVNGIIGGRTVVTTGGQTDWATSNAVSVAGTWEDGGSGTVIHGALPNGTAVSFNTSTGGAGLVPGRLYYVVLSDNATTFQVVDRPGAPNVVTSAGSSGTLTIDTQGNIAPYTAYLTNFAADGATDSPSGNYLVTGDLTGTALSTVVNSLKIANTAPAVMDLTAAGIGLMQFTSSGILFTGSADYTITGDPRYRLNGLGNNLIINTYGTGKLILDVKIRNNPLTKNGPGTLVLTSAYNDFREELFVNEGTINFNQLHALGTGHTIVLNGGGLQYATGYTGPTDLTKGGGLGNQTNPDPQNDPRAVILGPGGGTIDTNGNDVAFASSIGGGNADGFTTFFGNTIPTGGLTKAGAGTLTLAATNAYAGTTRLAGGVLSVSGLADGGAPSSIGISLAAPENLVFDGGTLQYTGAAASTNRNFTLTQNGGTIDSSSGTNAGLAFSNSSAIVATGTGARTLALTGSSTGASTLALLVVDASGVGNTTALSKTGPGTWALTNANTYTGGTNVSNGILLARNTSGSATGTGNVVMDGGTLGGNGSVSNVVAGAGAHTIAPSATLTNTSATTLTMGGLTTSANTTLAFNLVTPGTSSVSDRINVTGAAALNLNGGTLQITGHGVGPGSLGFYKAIGYNGSFTGSYTAITRPATDANKIVYTLDIAHDTGFIDVHRGFEGDANDDGLVNFQDFVRLSNNYGLADKGWFGGDFNGDGTTNFADFVKLSNNYGNTVGGGSIVVSPEELAALSTFAVATGPATPEPASLALLSIGAAGLLMRRRSRSRS